jgi:radical SAM superfamily enzyme YgiQ (UPF0313 family)
VVEELKYLEAHGYGSVYFVDDHFLLQPKRIDAICQGVTDARLTIQWGIEGRVDSVAQHLFPAMAKAHCRTVMFGIESGSQKILDRLKKDQTLDDVTKAVTNAKKAGIEIVHGFFTVGNPDETVEDMRATFDFASKLPLDTFGFNRLCVYRGTPLWQEYVKRGLVSDVTDWYKYFKCSEIDPTCLPGEVINNVRQRGLRRLFLYKLMHYPLQTYRLLRRFLRFMPVRDVVYLIVKPFLGKGKGATKAEVLSRAVEHAEMKDEAAQLTQLSDELLHTVLEASRAERLRIQQDAEGLRELPMVSAR